VVALTADAAAAEAEAEEQEGDALYDEAEGEVEG
jgi:hypothetical protein